VYTQTTDVESEVNGLMTYDRAVRKLDPERVLDLHRKLYAAPPQIVSVVATSREQSQTWRITTEEPGGKWFAKDFDDSNWRIGQGGFGTTGTPGANVQTEWSGSDLWLRRSFQLQDVVNDLHLTIHHDEDAEVYLNGLLAAKLDGYTVDYQVISIPPDALRALHIGDNVMAVHCHQTDGGQYIDAGLIRLIESSE
jgi:hypothetical protein